MKYKKKKDKDTTYQLGGQMSLDWFNTISKTWDNYWKAGDYTNLTGQNRHDVTNNEPGGLPGFNGADFWTDIGKLEVSDIHHLSQQAQAVHDSGQPQKTNLAYNMAGAMSGLNYLNAYKPPDPNYMTRGNQGVMYGQYGGEIPTNTTGYTPGTPTFNNPMNRIPGGNITMRDTPFPVLGIASSGQTKYMHPGENYIFPNAKYVDEIPLAQHGLSLNHLFPADQPMDFSFLRGDEYMANQEALQGQYEINQAQPLDIPQNTQATPIPDGVVTKAGDPWEYKKGEDGMWRTRRKGKKNWLKPNDDVMNSAIEKYFGNVAEGTPGNKGLPQEAGTPTPTPDSILPIDNRYDAQGVYPFTNTFINNNTAQHIPNGRNTVPITPNSVDAPRNVLSGQVPSMIGKSSTKSNDDSDGSAFIDNVIKYGSLFSNTPAGYLLSNPSDTETDILQLASTLIQGAGVGAGMAQLGAVTNIKSIGPAVKIANNRYLSQAGKVYDKAGKYLKEVTKNLKDQIKKNRDVGKYKKMFEAPGTKIKAFEKRASMPQPTSWNTPKTTFQFGGLVIPSYQFGGQVGKLSTIVYDDDEEIEELQAEVGEVVYLPNITIADVKATKKHTKMGKDFVSDILPGGSYIFSDDPKMALNRNKGINGIKFEDMILGKTVVQYKEGENTPGPEDILFTDIWKKDEETPAQLAKNIRKKLKILDVEDGDFFTEKANEENRSQRVEHLEILKALNEFKKPKSKRSPEYAQYGHYVPSAQSGRQVLGAGASGAAAGAVLGVPGIIGGAAVGIIGSLFAGAENRKKKKQAEQRYQEAFDKYQAGINNSYNMQALGPLAQYMNPIPREKVADYSSSISSIESARANVAKKLQAAQYSAISNSQGQVNSLFRNMPGGLDPNTVASIYGNTSAANNQINQQYTDSLINNQLAGVADVNRYRDATADATVGADNRYNYNRYNQSNNFFGDISNIGANREMDMANLHMFDYNNRENINTNYDRRLEDTIGAFSTSLGQLSSGIGNYQNAQRLDKLYQSHIDANNRSNPVPETKGPGNTNYNSNFGNNFNANRNSIVPVTQNGIGMQMNSLWPGAGQSIFNRTNLFQIDPFTGRRNTGPG